MQYVTILIWLAYLKSSIVVHLESGSVMEFETRAKYWNTQWNKTCDNNNIACVLRKLFCDSFEGWVGDGVRDMSNLEGGGLKKITYTITKRYMTIIILHVYSDSYFCDVVRDATKLAICMSSFLARPNCTHAHAHAHAHKQKQTHARTHARTRIHTHTMTQTHIYWQT